MGIALIVAMTKQGVIGRDNDLPWPMSDLSEDRKNFRKLTTGNTVIMGRNTWASIPDRYRPLPDRRNIVVSSTMGPSKGLIVAKSLEEALDKSVNTPFLIGGRGIYEEGLDFAETAFVTWTDKSYSGNVFFPRSPRWPDFLPGWELHGAEEFSDAGLCIYKRCSLS